MIRKIYKSIFSEKRRLKNRLSLNKLTSVFYRGKKYTCNCCNLSFRKFKPRGSHTTRFNAECPYCGSLERTRLLLFYLQNETDVFKKEAKLLHFAPEWALYPIFKKTANLEYISVDINPNLADYIADIQNIPYPDNSFDYIICSHVLGHVPDEDKAVREMSRVLKPNGKAFIMSIQSDRAQTYENDTVKTPEERLKHYTEPDLLRLHGQDFTARLSGEGKFNVQKIDYRKQMGEEVYRQYSLGDGHREMIYVCTK